MTATYFERTTYVAAYLGPGPVRNDEPGAVTGPARGQQLAAGDPVVTLVTHVTLVMLITSGSARTYHRCFAPMSVLLLKSFRSVPMLGCYLKCPDMAKALGNIPCSMSMSC